ncbi:MAG: hypothetical protein IJB79_06570 [Candidatus Gastranaerophilales bacterium]|nr:hypothetical protein [Candidatus Gastranaerophilales bacterium]
MRKIILAIFLLFFAKVNAQNLDFNKVGNADSNKILKNFIQQKLNSENFDVVSYFVDIDDDSKKEILGIVKSQYFYSLAGYKLFVLKENNSNWEAFKSDIHFDNTQNFEVENKKIIYYKTVFYKNKKCKAKIKKNKIKTSKSFMDIFVNKKAHDIEEITKFEDGHVQNNLNIEDFHAQKQRNVDFHYVNLNEKTKHYLDLK